MFLMEGNTLAIGHIRKTGKTIWTSFMSTILDTMKVSKRVNGCQWDGFSNVGTRTGAIKFAMAGTQDWWCRFPILLGY